MGKKEESKLMSEYYMSCRGSHKIHCRRLHSRMRLWPRDHQLAEIKKLEEILGNATNKGGIQEFVSSPNERDLLNVIYSAHIDGSVKNFKVTENIYDKLVTIALLEVYILDEYLPTHVHDIMFRDLGLGLTINDTRIQNLMKVDVTNIVQVMKDKGYFYLLNDRQITALEDMVSFRLMPLLPIVELSIGKLKYMINEIIEN